jgi:hypothetical protein
MRPSGLTSFFFFGLMRSCLDNGRVGLARSLYGLARQTNTVLALQALMAPSLPREFVARTLVILEEGYAGG